MPRIISFIIIDSPTIGVAKNILCSSVNADDFIDIDGVFSGSRMIKEKKKPIYKSVGHKINLINPIRIVKQLVMLKERIPKLLRGYGQLFFIPRYLPLCNSNLAFY